MDKNLSLLIKLGYGIVLLAACYFFLFVPLESFIRYHYLQECLSTAKKQNTTLFSNFYKDPGYFGGTSNINQQVSKDWQIRNESCYQLYK